MKQIVVLVLAISFFLSVPTVFAQTSSDARIEKARQAAQKFAGSKKKVSVKMREGDSFRGHITAVSQDAFTLAKVDGGATETIAYKDVVRIRKAGTLGTGAWVTIAALAATGIIVAAVLGKRICNESAC